jgi:carbonic anhydrase
MIDEIEKILVEGNLKFQGELTKKTEKIDLTVKIPKYPVLILTCMDPRIDAHRIFGLNIGDVFILRNAGNLVALDTLRSILIAIHEYNVKYIVVLGHLDCGMTKIRLEHLKLKLLPKTRDIIRKTEMNFDAEFRDFFKPFVDSIKNIINQVKTLREFKGFPEYVKVIGMLYDVDTGFIFDEELIESMEFEENFRYNYQTLLKKKRLELSYYLKGLKPESVIREKTSLKNNLKKEMELKQELKQEPKIDITENKISKAIELTQKYDAKVFENKNLISMPKIIVPSIIVPKVNIIVPSMYKIKKLQNNNSQGL